MQRRAFLTLMAAMPWLNPLRAASNPVFEKQDRYLLIPGYQVKQAINQGVVKNRVGNTPGEEQTIVSRLDLSTGKIIRRILPLKGHEIRIHPNGKSAFFACQSHRQMLSFNIENLEIEQLQQTYGEEFVGGGHALYTADGNYLITTERRVSRGEASFSHQNAAYYGQISIRDARSLKVIQAYSSHGILPHELQFINGEKQIAIAHYGSVAGKQKNRINTIEPSITVLDLSTGKLLDKYIAPVNDYEIRHLAVRRQTQRAEYTEQEMGRKKIAQKVKDNQSYNDSVIAVTNRLVRSEMKQQHFPAPAFSWSPRFNHEHNNDFSFDEQIKLHRSQSVVYEPQYDEAIVTVTEAHQIAVLDAVTGRLKKTIDCCRFNLKRPRGLCLMNHSDYYPDYYVVAGSFHGVVLIQRGTHKPVKYFDTPLYQHSHITIA